MIRRRTMKDKIWTLKVRFVFKQEVTLALPLWLTIKNPLLRTKVFKQPVDGSYLSGIIYHTGSLVPK